MPIYYHNLRTKIHIIYMIYILKYKQSQTKKIRYFINSINFIFRWITAARVHKKSCPLKGRYDIFTGSDICKTYLSSRCKGNSILELISSCSPKPG